MIEGEIEKLRLPRRSAGSSGNLLELGVNFYKMTTVNGQQTTVVELIFSRLARITRIFLVMRALLRLSGVKI